MLQRILGLFREPDPTTRWLVSSARPLVLDLETGALNDIRPNAPYTDLEKWGRPANPRPLSDKCLAYPAMGITFLAAEERLKGADLHFQARDVFGATSTPALYDGFVPASLRMVAAGGSEMRVTSATTPDEVRARLGKGWPHENPEWLGLLYQRGGWELEFEFDADRALSSVHITYHEDGRA
jgi:hypothetical protein